MFIKMKEGPMKGQTVEKSDFVGNLLIRKGKASKAKEEKQVLETKELKTETKSKKK